MSKKSVTIQDVARAAGVSTATVSRALSTPESVSVAKRDAVNGAVLDSGYRLNRAARNLRMQRSNTVLALLPSLGNPFFSQVLQGIESVLTPAGRSLLVAETKQISVPGDSLANYLEDGRADAAIVLDGSVPLETLQEVQKLNLAHQVIFACEWQQSGGFASVRSANSEGAEAAVEHLHNLGHRNIAHVTGPNENVLTIERLAGYTSACHKLSLERILIEGDFSLAAGEKAANQLLSINPLPTAVFCASDTIAIGVISTLARHGLNVPKDISIVGFDDIEYCQYVVPALTSIRQDRTGIGATAASMLLDNMETGHTTEEVESIPVQLISRDSCTSI